MSTAQIRLSFLLAKNITPRVGTVPALGMVRSAAGIS